MHVKSEGHNVHDLALIIVNHVVVAAVVFRVLSFGSGVTIKVVLREA
jgi:hypothetical protein